MSAKLPEISDAHQRHAARGAAPPTLVGKRALAPRAASSTVAALRSEVRDLARRDYAEALHRCLSRWEVREIVKEGKNRVWPGLNRQPVTLVSPEEFVRRWSNFGVDFRFANLSWKRGLSLLGFYAQQLDGARKRPLIFVNTAHHKAIVGVAMDHEMGHHLTSRIFTLGEETSHFLSLTGFGEHLETPTELAADILVSLATIPAHIARKVLDSNENADARDVPDLKDRAFVKVLEYVADRYDLQLAQIRQAEKKLQALATLIHYMKLRRALLDEYDT